MKKHLTLLTFFLFSIVSFGQITIDEVLSIKEEKMPIYEPEIISGTQLYLKMNYGSSTIANPREIKKLKGALIASVDIVYSDHPQGDKYPSLTRKRIENLKKLYPTLFTSNDIQWKLVRQTNCSDKNSAQRLFHGIVITYRPAQTEESTAKEIAFLDSILSKPEKLTSTGWSYTTIYDIDPITGERTVVSSSDTVFHDFEFDGELGPYFPTFRTRDSVVKTVLDRNKWNDMAIVCDLTGSMSPYSAQLFVWLRLNTSNDRVKQFVFFNDGDRTPDNKKVIGKTGGIYDIRSSSYEDVEELAFKTMRNGCGGDMPENDIEALLKTTKLCPTCDNIVLIADNWANIKDIANMSQLKKPIKIILCGADFGINTEYLDLARATGGSVHTIEEDLTELIKLSEGQEITIQGQTFKIEKGKFVKISKT